MRVGKWIEHLQSAVKATNISDPALRITAIGRQLGYAIYLVNDTLIWVLFHLYLRSVHVDSR